MISDYIKKMGNSWFVSYAYHKAIDTNHRNWENTETVPSRISWFESSREYHKIWLSEILNKSDARLGKNKLGLTAADIKSMARELLGEM